MRNKISLILIFSMVLIFALMLKSNAAVQVVPTSANYVLTNVTASESFDLCKGMTNKGETLYGSSVLPHLVTNADWGAVSYLANSVYGSNTAYQNTGTTNVQVTINSVKYYSTNGNLTGVMNWGSNPSKITWTQTASLNSKYTKNGNKDVDSLEKHRGTRYVESIDVNFTNENTRGKALKETAGVYSSWNTGSADHSGVAIIVRNGIYGYAMAWASQPGFLCTGVARSDATCRAAFWNK